MGVSLLKRCCLCLSSALYVLLLAQLPTVPHIALTSSSVVSAPTPSLTGVSAPIEDRRLALLYHGTTGESSWDEHQLRIAGGGSPSDRAARIAWAMTVRNIISFNARVGWHTDVFLHTWDVAVARDVAQLTNATAFSGGIASLNGHVVSQSAWASAELAMLLMREHSRRVHESGIDGKAARAAHAAYSHESLPC